MKLAPTTQAKLRSCTWFKLDRKKLLSSKATLWVLVLRGFERNSFDYIILEPRELAARLERLHGISDGYQVYVWVTKHVPARAWLTRDLGKVAQNQIGDNSFDDNTRDLMRYLNDWSAVSNL